MIDLDRPWCITHHEERRTGGMTVRPHAIATHAYGLAKAASFRRERRAVMARAWIEQARALRLGTSPAPFRPVLP